MYHFRCLLLCLSLANLAFGRVAAEDPRSRVVFDASITHRYPPTAFVIDVTDAPYHAKGDGQTDDTAAIQQALDDTMGQHKMLYFPAGTYLVSSKLVWSKQASSGQEAWGFNFLQGQNALHTTIRLKDGTFTDSSQPDSIMWCGGFGSADWFHNYVQDITFNVGRNNPGAIGLQFYSNNSGAVRNCRFVSEDGQGWIGLDLAHRDMNGPLLVKNCSVDGFQRGVVTGNAVNSQVFEYLDLRNQTQFGFENQGQTISLRGLYTKGEAPAIQSYGSLALIEAELIGIGSASDSPAIINYNGGSIYLRDVATEGFSRAVGDVATPDSWAARQRQGDDPPGSLGPKIDQYSSRPPIQPFPSDTAWTRLPILETPTAILDDPATWANVDDFGADPSGQFDSAVAVQRAIDSGAMTIFLPGSYRLMSTVEIRGAARRIVGVGGSIDYEGQAKPDFRIVDGSAPVVSLEHFSHIHGGIEIDTPRTVVFVSVSDCDLTMTDNAEGGELFAEDFVTHHLQLNKQRLWARQLDIENEGLHLLNQASDLWILGYKTERGGTLLETRGGGRSEILGGFSYTTTAGTLAPMFSTIDASVFAYFREICFNDDPYAVIVEESQGGVNKRVRRGEGEPLPYIAIGQRRLP